MLGSLLASHHSYSLALEASAILKMARQRICSRTGRRRLESQGEDESLNA